MNKITFENKVALVIGAASGMGLAGAKTFVKAGAAVELADWDEQAVQVVADELVAAGHKAIGIGCGVADGAQVAAMIARTVAVFGRLDAAFNNAGVQSPIAETIDADGAEFDRVTAINLRSVWSCMKYELQQMRDQSGGALTVRPDRRP